jgi:hypothetical protein
VEYQDPNNPTALYYQLTGGLHEPPARLISQTYRAMENFSDNGIVTAEIKDDQLCTERQESAPLQFIKGIYAQAQHSASVACSRASGTLVYLR